MKSPLFSALGKALSLVRKSDVAAATDILRKALSGQSQPETKSADAALPAPSSSRRPLGEVLHALQAGRRGLLQTPGSPQTPDAPRRFIDDMKFTARHYSGPAGQLDYRLYVPAHIENRQLSLVLMLHGCTQNPEDFALGTRMNALAEEFGLIVAYPHQPRKANSSGCWNWFDSRHQKRGHGEPAMLAGLTQMLATEFKIRPGQVFAAGLSAGGAMVDVLAATYPDVFAAVGIHSGLPYCAAHNALSAFSAMKGTQHKARGMAITSAQTCRKIIFHGSNDPTVHQSNGKHIFEQMQRATKDAVERQTEEKTADRAFTRMIMQDAKGDVLAEYWSVHGAGHAWSGGDRRGTYTDASGPEASRAMVDFFLQRPGQS